MSLFDVVEIPVDSVKVIDRAREELTGISDLADDITSMGLLYPILVNEDFRLLEGGRRLAAYKHLQCPTIPARVLPNINDDDALIIELIGNSSREPFKWFEELDIKAKLHRYWVEQAKPASWGYRETAEKLKVSLGGLSTDLSIAEAIKAFPELKEAETKRKAQDLYKRMVDQVRSIKAIEKLPDEDKANLARLLGHVPPELLPKENKDLPKAIRPDTPPEFSSDTGKETPRCSSTEQESTENGSSMKKLPDHKYAIASWEDFIPQIPNNSVGLVELDPPYAIEFNETYGKTGNIASKATDWTVDKLKDHMRRLLPMLYDKLIDNSWVICWTGKEHWQWINEGAAQCGFKTQSPGIWVKTGGSCNSARTTMVSNYEVFLLFRKGVPQFNLNSFPAALTGIESENAHNRVHQWEKPVALYDYFIKQLGRPEAIFLSPFAGSGNSMLSAAINKMIPFGCDEEQKYVYYFYQNMQKHFLQGEDF
jgi:ParB-like chromosome segregation protein Spo0J/DNA modification methylase